MMAPVVGAMRLHIVSGTANPALADRIGKALDIELTPCNVERFPDGELRPTVGPMRDGDVYVVQPTGPPVNERIIELLLIIDACRRAGAARITAVVPYFGYARQDRRNREGQSVGAKVVVKTIADSGADRLIVVDPHTAAIEGMSPIPVEMLTAVPRLAGVLEKLINEDSVVVAPDLGAVKLAEHYGSLLRKPVAVVQKTRLSGSEVEAETLIGNVVGRHAVIVDDMISTGATIAAAAEAVLERGALPDLLIAATHGLLVRPHIEVLASLRIADLLVTDTVQPTEIRLPPVRVTTIAPLIAEAVERLHHRRSLEGLAVQR